MVIIIIIMIIIIKKLLKQDYKVQLVNNKIPMAWLTCWPVVGVLVGCSISELLGINSSLGFLNDLMEGVKEEYQNRYSGPKQGTVL